MPKTLTQTPVALQIVHETDPRYCREEVSLLLGHLYPAGLVLGQVTAVGPNKDKYGPHDPTAEDGRETMAALLIYRQYPDDTEPLDGAPVRVAALVRGPASVTAGSLVRHPSIDSPAEKAAQDAALLTSLGIRVLPQA